MTAVQTNEGMRMAELTRVSGVPTATIKFYLREGLLQPGHRTAPNQATYDESHLRRLRLVRALREVGGLRIETIRRVIESVDGAERPWHVVGRVCDAIGESVRGEPAQRPETARAEQDVDAFLVAQGLPVRPESTSRMQLIEALVALRAALGTRFPVDILTHYSEAVRGLARKEVEVSQAYSAGRQTERGAKEGEQTAKAPVDLAAILEGIVYGTVLFEPVLLALRRLWHERYAEEIGMAELVKSLSAKSEPDTQVSRSLPSDDAQ